MHFYAPRISACYLSLSLSLTHTHTHTGNLAVQWLLASVGVLGVMGVLGVIVQRRLGGGKLYLSVPAVSKHSDLHSKV